MENQQKTNLLLPSPRTLNTNNNGLNIPQPITRSDSTNPYPTTFVQADTSSFKQVVQMLTGSSETVKQASSPRPGNPTHHNNIPPIKTNPKKTGSGSGFKLYERRNSLNHLKINPLNPIFSTHNSGFSPRKPEILSPSILDFPSLVLSPVTPLIPDPFDPTRLNAEAEEKAIKEKGFFLHPSPRALTPRDAEPRLLPLFPTTSPRAAAASGAFGQAVKVRVKERGRNLDPFVVFLSEEKMPRDERLRRDPLSFEVVVVGSVEEEEGEAVVEEEKEVVVLHSKLVVAVEEAEVVVEVDEEEVGEEAMVE
ncbi:hypothetical protein RIF29_41358 [Crotalaria pallida]|uniref:VQ domain-containing protein n=1 Tax=Crotalaria pallida TaxID=3830 RepID=A0AAN9E592_CROPI